jgi:hypothetical protein
MMAVTKRVMVNLTKGMESQLIELEKIFGEGHSQVLQRALLTLYNLTIKDIPASKA